MGSAVAERTRHFYAWERRGRGWQQYPHPVDLEPPFVPFRHLPRVGSAVDDGRHHTALSGLLAQLFRKETEEPQAPTSPEEPAPGPAPEGELVESRVLLPRDLAVTPSLAEAFLKSVAALRTPFSFELVGAGGGVSLLLSMREEDVPLLSAQTRAFFPGVILEASPDVLLSAWEVGEPGRFSALELGLAREFMLPLSPARSFAPDPLTALAGILSATNRGEVLVVQAMFQGVAAPWAENIVRSVTTSSGDTFFADAPEMTALARQKTAAPLFAVALRLAVRAGSDERARTLLYGALSALSATTRGDNELVPLGGDPEEVLEDVLLRTTHRSGFLASLPELLPLVHFPSPSVEGIVRDIARTKPLPDEAQGAGILLGDSTHAGVTREVRLSDDIRLRHLHVVGASGTGKSTLLVAMIIEDLRAGHGVGVIDPHGDLIEEVLSRVPPEREDDVILFDPADPEYAVGWNMLSAGSEAEKDMLASDLVAVFRRLATSWGDQMTAVLANAILAFLESDRGGTLMDLRRFLADASFRQAFLTTVKDEYARDFWTTEFQLLSGKPQASILTRLDALLRGRLVRGVVTAAAKPLDFRRVVDDRRIFLAKLSQGAIGEENAALLGSLLVSKLHQVCLLRQDQAEANRRPFFLYLDEFHHLATPSMATLFSGARKYRLGLTVAHQDLYQLRSAVPEVERAVLGNAYTRICFRLGDEDAKTLAQGFSFFSADDLGNLATGEAIGRLGRKEHDFAFRTRRLEADDAETLTRRRLEIRERSLARWGSRRETMKEPPPPPAEEASSRREREPEVERPIPKAPLPPTRPSSESAPTPERPAPAETRRPGKGGPEHTYLQELIKRYAEEYGFRAVVEEQIPGGRESVDVALYRGTLSLACEITVTTPLDHEVGNVAKCLAAGFGVVALVSVKKARLAKLRALLDQSLSTEEKARVHLFTPEDLLAWLAGQPSQEEEGTVGGYKVKVRYQRPEDARTKRVAEILAKSMGRMKGE